MDARFNLYGTAVGMKFGKLITSAGRATESALPTETRELVALRVSQINGCGFCADAHTKEAEHAGVSRTRINLVATWREATVYSEAERAAFALAEQATRIADSSEGVSDEVWADAARHYDDERLAALLSHIAVMNAFNRLNVVVRQPAGDYQPGQFG
ncbi:carboxymuconolactone decarboxylase family protein [Actinomadura sp. NAK00032]|uniref:carboxymuconolactone decarboxylase family protein n=1 Tax=Actinomadura sp. NAK00032 TaxID=2742128 RepID=UPI0015920DAA|nr:carboxymuconolactone decarboxylase family protein [Actinomadura sp. NAK00032]QKW39677.1 carboxymuconolactone decarboxylase family protein [Actinomadura sp. NAK00032]